MRISTRPGPVGGGWSSKHRRVSESKASPPIQSCGSAPAASPSPGYPGDATVTGITAGCLRIRPNVVQAETRDRELDVLDQQLVGPVPVDVGRRERRAPRVALERPERCVGHSVTGRVARRRPACRRRARDTRGRRSSSPPRRSRPRRARTRRRRCVTLQTGNPSPMSSAGRWYVGRASAGRGCDGRVRTVRLARGPKRRRRRRPDVTRSARRPWKGSRRRRCRRR